MGYVVQTVTPAGLGMRGSPVGRSDRGQKALELDFSGNGET